jgi:twinkle protein
MLSELHMRGLERRGISPETAVRFGIYTARSNGNAVVPDASGNVIAFPYFERGSVVAEKYRAPPKRFWQRPNGRKTFWNADVLDDPALAHQSLIITEGEFDALTAIECGHPFVVSVPEGAPAVPDGAQPNDLPPIDPRHESEGKFEFLWNNRDRLKRVFRFVIAADADAPGQRLAAELVRRLSAVRCMFVNYPEGCKDLNDVLQRFGREAVTAVINSAKPYPVKGLYRLSDYPDAPKLETFKTGWDVLDHYLKLFAGEFMVVTGIPSMGKSTWVLNLLVNLYHRHKWRSAIFSPEMKTVPHLRDKLRRIMADRFAPQDMAIEDAFVFIDSDPTGNADDENLTVDWIIDKAIDAVLRDGIRVLVIDPWNEIEHAKNRDETMTEYVGRSIRQLKRFAREREVVVIMIAHPTKDVHNKDGNARPPTLYDIEQSASWFNKSDHGVCIHRPDAQKDEALIAVQKVRFDETGEKGNVLMKFERTSCRYLRLDEPV